MRVSLHSKEQYKWIKVALMNRGHHWNYLTYIPNEKMWTCQFYHVKQQKENMYLSGNIHGRFLSLISLKCICFCRDEHTDWLRSGTWAKDSWSSSESLPEVERLGERHTDFGSCEGEKRACVVAHSSRAGGCCQPLYRKLMANDWLASCHLLLPQDKAANHKDIYPYVIQELRPTLDELGISTPEELGIDKV